MDKIITLLAVTLGWLLNELSNALRVSREDRRAVGPILRDLLEIRHRLFALDLAVAELKKVLPIPPEAELPVKQVLSGIVPEAPHFLERYEEAVSIVARADPLLAFRLGNQPLVDRVLKLSRGIAASDQVASKSWATVGEPEMLKLVKPHLEELILDVAGVHGFVTKWRTQRRLKKSLELTSDERKWISSAVTAAQTPQAPPPPKPSP